MGLFGAAHGWEGFLAFLAKNLSHISYKDETWQSYTLPKEDPKYTPRVLLTSAFFIGNQQVLLYQKIQMYIAFWYTISNSFRFF